MRRRTLDTLIYVEPQPENYILGTCTAPFNYTYGGNKNTYDGTGDFRLDFEYPTISSLKNLFSSAIKITKLDLSNFDTSNVINMCGMFSECYNIQELNLSNFDTSNVINMDQMFQNFGTGSRIDFLDLSNFDTSNVINLYRMFWSAGDLKKIDLSSFNTSKVTDMSYMFSYCYELTTLDLSNFDTSNVISMNKMFDMDDKLSHIKCKTAFRDWCWANAATIKLPDVMKEGGSGTWELVD